MYSKNFTNCLRNRKVFEFFNQLFFGYQFCKGLDLLTTSLMSDVYCILKRPIRVSCAQKRFGSLRNCASR